MSITQQCISSGYTTDEVKVDSLVFWDVMLYWASSSCCLKGYVMFNVVFRVDQSMKSYVGLNIWLWGCG